MTPKLFNNLPGLSGSAPGRDIFAGEFLAMLCMANFLKSDEVTKGVCRPLILNRYSVSAV